MIPGNIKSFETVTLHEKNKCTFRSYKTVLHTLSNYTRVSEHKGMEEFHLATLFSPFIVVRSDQIANNLNDVPMDVTYQITHQKKGNQQQLVIQYTAYFSDEDVSVINLEGHMTRYGRHSDIEWVYRVTFDVDREKSTSGWKVAKEEYQCPLAMGYAQVTCKFEGAHMNATHPIIYNDSRVRQNAFNDRGDMYGFEWQDYSYAGYLQHHPEDLKSRNASDWQHLFIGSIFVPNYQITYPMAREWLELSSDWMSSFCDQEAAREGKACHRADEYLYILYRGTLKGSFLWSFYHQIDQFHFIEYNDGENDIDRLGEDGFGKETISALYAPKALINRILSGNDPDDVIYSIRRSELHQPPKHRFFGNKLNPELLEFYVRDREANGKLTLRRVTDKLSWAEDKLTGEISIRAASPKKIH